MDVYDWHVRHQQPIQLTRITDQRMAIRFMFTQLILRHEQDPAFVGHAVRRPLEAEVRDRCGCRVPASRCRVPECCCASTARGAPGLLRSSPVSFTSGPNEMRTPLVERRAKAAAGHDEHARGLERLGHELLGIGADVDHRVETAERREPRPAEMPVDGLQASRRRRACTAHWLRPHTASAIRPRSRVFRYFAIVICDSVSGHRMLHCCTRSIASTTDGCASIQPRRRPSPRAHFEFEWMPTTFG